jgi:hypothetical protein
MPRLAIRRDRGWADKFRSYTITLDGREIGSLDECTTLCQEIARGPHRVEARIDWCRSETLQVHAQDADLDVLVKSALRGWRILLAPFYLVLNTRRYLTVELANPPLGGREIVTKEGEL